MIYIILFYIMCALSLLAMLMLTIMYIIGGIYILKKGEEKKNETRN